jgi:FkbM family methyltransferase
MVRDNNQNRIYLDLASYKINRKFWLSLPSQDRGLSTQLRLFGFREPLNCRCFVNFIDNNDTLLDIGSNIGFFAVLGGNAKRIICVEPLNSAIEFLLKNIQQNGLEGKCEVVHAAVGPKGKLQLEVQSHLNLSRIVNEKNINTIEVDSIPLGEFIREHPSNMVRLDVEGFEYDILYEQIPECINKISMEFHTGLLGEEKSEKLLEYFREEGFNVRYFVEDVPLRMYPFVRVFRSTLASGLVSYVKCNLDIEDIRERIFTGRSLKYLYLQR